MTDPAASKSLSRNMEVESHLKAKNLAISVMVAVALVSPCAFSGNEAQRAAPPIQTVSPPELVALEAKNRKDLQEHGYIERLDEIPRAEYIANRMQERLVSATSKDLQGDPKALGYYDISTLENVDDINLPFRPSILPHKFQQSEPESYLLLGGQTLKQLHKKSVFGPLIVDETIVGSSRLESPNLTIAGQPAVFYHVKWKGQAWSSVIHTSTGKRIFVVEAGKKLDGQAKDEFIQMVEELMSNAQAIH